MTILLLKIVGALALLIYGMKVMSEALQKLAGPQLRHVLSAMTTNRVSGVFTGMLTTVAVQSSTATTVMTVSFVNAGLLTLVQAISVIMGANIGTTLTAWIMSAGFSFKISDFVWPVFLIGLLLIYSKKNRYVGDFLFGVAFMFLALATLGESQLPPEELNALKAFFASFDPNSFGTILLFLIFGTILTCILQSSAALMAITMMLCTQAGLPIYLGIALVLGENIGTTLTANLVALTANTEARRAAFGHLFFNVFGVIWVLIIFHPFLWIIGRIVTLLGLPDPTTADLTMVDVNPVISTSVLYGVCTLHTLFNVTNTMILIWFVPQIEKLVTMLVPVPKGEGEVYRLKFIQGGPLSTAELSLDEAEQEIVHFSEICYNGFGYMRQAIFETDKSRFEDLRSKLVKYEGITDRIEYEIADYLNEVAKGEISEVSARRIKGMYKIIGELESLGDSGEAVGRMLARRNEHGKVFDASQLKRLNHMCDLLDGAYKAMMDNLRAPYASIRDISNAKDAEYNINEYRNSLREEHIINIEENPDYNYQTGVFYMDIVAELEKMGDFIINVSEAKIAENVL